MSKKKSRKRPSLAGTNLYYDERRETYYWRKVDTRTGRRLNKSTRQRSLKLALRVAAGFEDELRQDQAGVKVYANWRIELLPLVEEWIQAQQGRVTAKTLTQKRNETLRALGDLRLRVAADLSDVSLLDRRLRALGRRGLSQSTLRRSYQQPLKQFSRWLAGNNRYLERDPLLNWEAIKQDQGDPKRRSAYLPLDLAKGLLALDLFDQRERRSHPTRPVFLALLVTAPRVGAFISRSVADFEPEEKRIHYGKGSRNKRRGAGLLDDLTQD